MADNGRKQNMTDTGDEQAVETPESVNSKASADGMSKKAGVKKPGAGSSKKAAVSGKRSTRPKNAAAKRKQALRQEKQRINEDLKKTARKIMLGGTISTIIAIIGLALIASGHGGTAGKIGGFCLLLGVIGFGVLGGIVFRMYNSGQEAARKRKQRQRSQMARQDMQQFISNLSVETREKLMQVDARKKVSSGETAEAMFLKLNDDELSNALQFLCMTSRTGELELIFDDDSGKAVLHLGEGTILFARFGKHEGLEAIARMLKSGAAAASFYEGRKAPGKNIDMPISGILLNASVMGDELD